MFANLLRKKIVIEEKVKRIQWSYLELLKMYSKLDDDVRRDSSIEKVRNVLSKKQEELDLINEVYKTTINELKRTADLIRDSQNAAINLNDSLDQLCTSLCINFPEELDITYRIKQLAITDTNDEESDKENSVLLNEELLKSVDLCL